MKLRLGVDNDEVLGQSFKAILNNNGGTFGGTPLKYENIFDYHVENLPELQKAGITRQRAVEIFDTFIEHHRNKIEPVDDMQRILSMLKDMGYPQYQITARPDSLIDATISQTDHHYRNIFSDIIHTNYYLQNELSACKGDICKKLGITIMIEDNPHHAIKIATKGTPVIVPNRPRNKQLTNNTDGLAIYKIERTEEIIDVLKKLKMI